MRRTTMIRLAILIAVALMPALAQAADYPHRGDATGYTVNCGDCHWLNGSTPPWPAWSSSLDPSDNTLNNRRCYKCHETAGQKQYSQAAKTHSTATTSNAYWATQGGWNTECITCHNPHYQRQSAVYKAATFLATGAAPTYIGSWDTSTGLTEVRLPGPVKSGDWSGYYLLPDRNYAYYYKIDTWLTSTNTAFIRGTVNTAKVGATGYAILYSKAMKEGILYYTPGGQKVQVNVKFFQPQGTFSFSDRANVATSLCNVCHTKVEHMRAAWTSQTGVDQWHSNVTWNAGDNCMSNQSCHQRHPDGFKKGATCGDCHGTPPTDSTMTKLIKVGGVAITVDTGVDSSGAHGRHNNTDWQTFSNRKVDCLECHQGGMIGAFDDNAPDIGDYRIDIGFKAMGNAWYTGGLYKGQQWLSDGFTYGGYSAGTADNSRLCSNVYCHGGTIGGKSLTWLTIVVCGDCHNATAANPPTLGAHVKHAGTTSAVVATIACSDCHGHSGVKNVLHVNGQANWSLKTSDARFGGLATYKGGPSGSAGPVPSVSGSCNNLYCHSNANPVDNTAIWASVAWGTGSINCSSCHKMAGTTAAMSGMSKAHPIHAATDAYGNAARAANTINCSACHYAVTTNGTSIIDKTKHSDGIKQVDFNKTWMTIIGASADNYGTQGSYICSNIYCHSDGMATPTYKTVRWNSTGTGACGSCHGADNTTSPASAAHTAHVGTAKGYQYACSRCHVSVVTSTAGSAAVPAISSYALHVNKVREVAFDGFNNYATIVNGNCSQVYCHSDGITVAKGGKPTDIIAWTTLTNCATCHGKGGDGSGRPWYTAANNGGPKANSHMATTHAASACNVCHYTVTADGTTITGPSDHANKTYTVEPGGGSWFSYSYNAAGGKCSDVSCHGGTGTSTWGSSGSLTCGGCHPINNSLKGAHGKHWADTVGSADRSSANDSTQTLYKYRCGVCHYNINHATGWVTYNRTAEVVFDPTISKGGAYSAGSQWVTDNTYVFTNGTCVSTYCHSNGGSGTPKVTAYNWMTSNGNFAGGECKFCHGYTQASGTPMDTSMHSKHVNAYTYGCDKCHDTTTTDGTTIADKRLHVDNRLQVVFEGWNSQGKWATSNKTCTATYCHSTGYNWGTPIIGASWLSTGTGACGACHGADSSTAPVSVAHAKHVATASGYQYACFDCHNSVVTTTASSAVTPSIKSYGLHVNGAAEVAFGRPSNSNGTWATSTKTCSSTYCHSSGVTVSTGSWPTSAATWTTVMNCGSCHGGSSNGQPTYSSGKANSHVKHSTDCSVCHYATTTTGTTITTPSVHADGQYQLAQKTGQTSFSYTYNAAGGSCSSISCHFGGGATWGQTVACGNCHAIPPATNKHLTHTDGVGMTAYGQDTNWSTDGTYRFGCGNCHALDVSRHANSTKSVELWTSGATGFKKNTTSSAWYTPSGLNAKCGNIYCHSDGLGGAPKNTAFMWGTGTLNCAGCHGYTEASGAWLTTGVHQKHTATVAQFGCNACHTTTTANGTTVNAKEYHVNAIKDVYYDGWNTAGTWTTSTKTCSNLYCHSTAQGSNGLLSGITYATQTWNSVGSGACGTCHLVNGPWGSVISTGSHSKHLMNVSINGDCTICHIGSGASTALHVNKVIDVVISNAKGGSYSQYATAPGDGYGTCSSLSCHSNGVWGSSGSVSGGCSMCHKANNTLAGEHPKHYDSTSIPSVYGNAVNLSTQSNYRFDCGVCHNYNPIHQGWASGQTYTVVTFDSAISMGGTYTYGTAQPIDSYNWTNGTCSSTYCHSNGNGAGPNVTNFNWSTAPTSLGCTGCHNYDTASGKWMTSGVHTKHVNGYTQSCALCHSTTTNGWQTVTNKAMHVNNIKDIAYDSWNSTGAWVTNTKVCSSTYCHSDGVATMKTAVWTSAATGACGSCHGASNTASPTSAVHAKHVGNSVSGYRYSCDKCHDSVVYPTADSTVWATIKSPSLHVNKINDVTFNSFNTGATWNTVTKACATTYCHSSGVSVATGSVPANSITWSGSTTCITCHGNETGNPGNGLPWYTDVSLGGPKANSHKKHQPYDCSQCHNVTISAGWSTITSFADHADKGYDVNQKPGFTTFSYWFTTNGGSCSNISCHYNNTAKWGQALTCASCHSSLSGAHNIHIGTGWNTYGSDANNSVSGEYRFSCGNCHPLDSTKHANGSLDMELWTSNAAGFKVNTPYGAWITFGGNNARCGNVYCHSNGAAGANRTYAITLAWGTMFGTVNKCGQCHDNPPTYAGQAHYTSFGFMGKEGGHMVGIHWDNIFNGVNGRAWATTNGDAAHGNANIATTMTCYVCHSSVVSTQADTYSLNHVGSSSMKCSNAQCHASLQNGGISDKSLHVNAQPDVSFANIPMKSRAQVANTPSGWGRSGYKGTNAYDWATLAPATNTWNGAQKTCTTSCHLSQPMSWQTTSISCQSCHRSL